MARDLLPPARHVAELEQIGDAPVVRLQLGVPVARVACGRDHVACDGQALCARSGRHSATWRAPRAAASALAFVQARAVATASALRRSERVRSGA